MATHPVHVALPIVLTAAERATLERSKGLQGVRRSAFASRRETTGGDSPKNPGWAVLGLALLAASGLTGVLASLLP